MTRPDDPPRVPWPIGASLGGVVVYLLDAFVLNQGVVAVIAALLTVLMLVPALLVGLVRRDLHKVLGPAIRAGIFVLVAAAVLATNAWQNAAARRRAERIVDACERYHAGRGHYPDSLGELVPQFLPGVPRAKYVLGSSGFDYRGTEGRHTLMYVALPPFGRPYYVLEERRWGYLD